MLTVTATVVATVAGSQTLRPRRAQFGLNLKSFFQVGMDFIFVIESEFSDSKKV